jgi:Domain of unknown function (DUF4190)
VSTTPSDLPSQPSAAPTQIAGQQVAPSSSVPMGPTGAPYSPAATRTNTLAVVSLVTGIASFVAHIVPGVGGFTVALIAVITGYLARKQIKETGEKGMGMATAGMVIGAIHLVLIVIAVLAVLFLIFVVGIAVFGHSR